MRSRSPCLIRCYAQARPVGHIDEKVLLDHRQDFRREAYVTRFSALIQVADMRVFHGFTSFLLILKLKRPRPHVRLHLADRFDYDLGLGLCLLHAQV